MHEKLENETHWDPWRLGYWFLLRKNSKIKKKNHVQVELIKEQNAKQICFQKCGLYNFVHILFVLALNNQWKERSVQVMMSTSECARSRDHSWKKKKTHPKYLSYITLTSGPATVIRPFSLIFFKIETGRWIMEWKFDYLSVLSHRI